MFILEKGNWKVPECWLGIFFYKDIIVGGWLCFWVQSFDIARKLGFPVVFACSANTLYSNYLICNLKCCVTLKTVELVLLRNLVTFNSFFIQADVNSLSSREVKSHSYALSRGIE